MKYLLSLAILLSSLSQAQIVYNDSRSEYLKAEDEWNMDRKKIRDANIRSSKGYFYKVKDGIVPTDGKLMYDAKYDANGNLISYRVYNKNGQGKYYFDYKYDDENRVTEISMFKPNGKLIYKGAYQYDAAGNNTDTRYYYDNRKADYVYWHSIASFDGDRNMTELKYLGKNDTRQNVRYVYSYYPDGSKKQTMQYDRKDRLKHTWNYDCNPSGTLTDKALHDSSKICVRYETDPSGNRIRIKEENLVEKSIRRRISKYDSNDNLVDIVQYDKNDKQYSHSEYAYDNKNNMTGYSHYDAKNKLKEKVTYAYDTNGNMTERAVYKKSNQPESIAKYTYSQQ